MNQKLNAKKPAVTLAKGQLWKMEHAYIYVVDLGKRLIHFKMMESLGQTWVKTQISGIDTLSGYLQARKAKLIKDGLRGVFQVPAVA